MGGATTYVGSAAALYCMHAVWVMPHVWDYFNIHYAGNFTQHVFKKLLCFERIAYMLHGHVLCSGIWGKLGAVKLLDADKKYHSNSDSLV